MSLDTIPSDQPSIRLPLPGYAKGAVTVWAILFLASPLMVFFRFSMVQVLILAAIIAGFVLPFLLGRLPGELEAASEQTILLNPRSHRYPWLYLLGRDNLFIRPAWTFTVTVADTNLLWQEQRLSLACGGTRICLGTGPRMEPVRAWLMRRGIHPA
jgi:hypothetical protein